MNLNILRRTVMPDEMAIPKTVTVPRPLSRKAQDAIEQHYSEIAALTEERDRAHERAKQGEELCAKASAKISALSDEIADLKGRMTGYQLERDEAVAKYAKLEGLFVSIQAQLRAYEIPNAPAVRVAPDAETPAVHSPTSDEPYVKVPPTHKEMSARIK